MITVERYTPAMRDQWNDAVEASRNGTFLHRREYMDYHSDRFNDFSLVARSATGNILALLPADKSGTSLRSHAGLTYGGWLMLPKADMNAMLDIWTAARNVAQDSGIDNLIYKPVPHIFHRYPAEEDLYCLFRDGASIASTQVSSVIDLQNPMGFDQNARRASVKAIRRELHVAESHDYATFWQILCEVLASRHNTLPVHTLAEISMLAGRFPENIRLYGVFDKGRMVAGSVVYITHTTVHAQYIASDDIGRRYGALALLFDNLATTFSDKVRYLDFGTSNEDAGRILNSGLIRQKCGFGARAVAFNTYKISWR